MRRLWCSLTLFSLAACGDSSGPDEWTPDDFVGVWEVEVPATSGCWQAFAIRFEVLQSDAEGYPDDGGLLNFVDGEWYLASNTSARSGLSGHFNWDDGDFVAVFQFQGSTSLRYEGTDSNPESVTGTFRDRDGIVFPEGCSATATATKLAD